MRCSNATEERSPARGPRGSSSTRAGRSGAIRPCSLSRITTTACLTSSSWGRARTTTARRTPTSSSSTRVTACRRRSSATSSCGRSTLSSRTTTRSSSARGTRWGIRAPTATSRTANRDRSASGTPRTDRSPASTGGSTCSSSRAPRAVSRTSQPTRRVTQPSRCFSGSTVPSLAWKKLRSAASSARRDRCRARRCRSTRSPGGTWRS